MTKRLKILESSLQKKQAQFDAKLQAHFDTVKQANGQPLNDKRDGQATLDKWNRQSDHLRSLQEGIEKTKAAIEREKDKIARVNEVSKGMPAAILKLVEKGTLTQWRKHPRFFFVTGVDKARIVWDEEKQVVAHRYYNSIPDVEQRQQFAAVYNALYNELQQDSEKMEQTK